MYSSVGACVHCNLVLENLYMISQFVALRLRDSGSESSLQPRRGGGLTWVRIEARSESSFSA